MSLMTEARQAVDRERETAMREYTGLVAHAEDAPDTGDVAKFRRCIEVLELSWEDVRADVHAIAQAQACKQLRADVPKAKADIAKLTARRDKARPTKEWSTEFGRQLERKQAEARGRVTRGEMAHTELGTLRANNPRVAELIGHMP